MARIDQRPEDRDRQPLQLDSIVTCPECETDFDAVFTAAEGVYEREDLIDAPVQRVVCPKCGHAWDAEWEGWLAHEDAG